MPFVVYKKESCKSRPEAIEAKNGERASVPQVSSTVKERKRLLNMVNVAPSQKQDICLLNLTCGMYWDETVERPSLHGKVRDVARNRLAQYRAVGQIGGEGRHALGHARLA